MSVTATPPTIEDFREERLESVRRELDDSWRHGNRVHEVFHRKEDGTYWSVKYRLSTDGETNGLLDDDEAGYTTIVQVSRIERPTIQVDFVEKQKGAEAARAADVGLDGLVKEHERVIASIRRLTAAVRVAAEQHRSPNAP